MMVVSTLSFRPVGLLCGFLRFVLTRAHLFLLQSKGTEVVDSLQYLCSNDVDIPVGGIIHTGMQNKNGGYENDCSLARIAMNQ